MMSAIAANKGDFAFLVHSRHQWGWFGVSAFGGKEDQVLSTLKGAGIEYETA